MKIYTKTGDSGTTGLFAGGRVPKDHPRINAYGSVDELNAMLGIVSTHAKAAPTLPELQAIVKLLTDAITQAQNDLFAIGAELATPNPTAMGTKLLTTQHVEQLEVWIDQLEDHLPQLTTFVLPGGSPLASWLHLARTVCRRAEREVVHLAHEDNVEDCSLVIIYLNRLSDLLFVMARASNLAHGIEDIPWKKPQ